MVLVRYSQIIPILHPPHYSRKILLIAAIVMKIPMNSDNDMYRTVWFFMAKYVGKKLSVVIPPEVFEVVEKLATKDSRSNSMMVVVLIKEALKARGIELDDTDD
jgi:hypothetical protein